MLSASRIRAVSLLLALGVLGSCESPTALLPTTGGLSPNAQMRRSGGGGGSFSVGVLSTTTIDYGSPGWVNTGIQVDSGYRYEVRVTGSVTASPNSELGCFGDINWATVPGMGAYGPGQPDPRGSAGGALGVTVAWDTLPESGAISLATTPDSSAWQSDTNPNGSTRTLWARRNNGPVGGTNCAGSPPGGGWYALSGNSTITVIVLPPLPPDSLLVSASPSTRVNEGTVVTYTARFTQSQNRVDFWQWQPDSVAGKPRPPSTDICVNTGNTCTHTPATSGTIVAVGGGKSTSLHVDVITCPFNDPIIDDPLIRTQLLTSFLISDSTKLERSGYIYMEKGSNPPRYSLAETFVPDSSTQCRNARRDIPDTNYVKVAGWHTHPGHPGMTFTNCPTYAPGAKAGRDPSDPDFQAQELALLPEYIMDEIEVTKINNHFPPPSINGRFFSLTRHPWKSCPNWAYL